MTAVTEIRKGKSTLRKALLVLLPILVIGGGVGGYMAYAASIGAINLTPAGSGTHVTDTTKAQFSVAITKQGESFANVVWMTQMALKGEYWSASCYAFCNGVTYKLDPTTVITNQGLDAEQCLVFGTSTTDTCTHDNYPTVIGLSESTATPAITDTYAGGSGQACASANEIHDSNGLGDVAGTVTPGTSGSTVTTTIANTFTVSTGQSYSNVQATGLYTATYGGTNPLLYACGTFGPDSLSGGNQLTITWTISRTA